MARQPLRGNPELKQVELISGFEGGINVTYADDLLPSQMMRNLTNFDMESIGELSIRKGFGLNNALTELLYDGGAYHNELVNLNTQTEVFFTLLTNDNSAWQRLADSKNYDEYVSTYGSTNSIRYLRLLVNANKSLYWEDVTIELTAIPGILITDGTITAAEFYTNDNLMNWEYVDKYGRLYFTNNNKGLLIFDAQSLTPATPWIFSGNFTGQTNKAYKPNGIEVRKIGFNVLGADPLTWVYESELTTESIQGVYLTTSDRKPIKIIPAGSPFQVNILYTGDTYNFKLAMTAYEDPIEITATKNAALSTNGSLAVYDVVLKTQPTGELEIAIDFDSATVEVETYFDYYVVGTIPEDAEVVTNLNVGEFKILESYDRMVYYKGNAVWFSEIDVYDYIPNFNYVLFPLDNTDEIVKIIFFRTSYIVFTKRRIYKLEGDFEQTTFNRQLVNDTIGCVSPHTAMVVDNQLLFVSTVGLRALKTDTFREDLENIKEFDESIRPLIEPRETMYAYPYRDQYVLAHNYRDSSVKDEPVRVGMRTFSKPDQVRFYYKKGSFVVDDYAKGEYPRFMFSENGQYYSFRNDGIYRLGDAYTDFGKSFNAVVETIGISFGYPTHEKKIKHALLKVCGGEYDQPVKLQVAADGLVVVSSEMYPSGIDANGTIVYTDENLGIPSSEPILSLFGEGATKYHTKKFRTAAKGKNISMRLTLRSSTNFSIQALGYIWKLGKVRE